MINTKSIAKKLGAVRIGALMARHAHLRNACATRRDRDRKEKHVF